MSVRVRVRIAWAGVALLALAGSTETARASEPTPPEPTPTEAKYFESKVRPLLVKNCFSCHGPKKQESGLRLDSRQAMLKGGESDVAIVPGKPDESILIDAVNYDGLEMPPKRRLNEQQVYVLKRWIKLGAPWPLDSGKPKTAAGRITDEERSYWAFQPVGNPAPPVLADDEWSTNNVDRFILRTLRKSKLAPAPREDRPTLIRRLSFDLLGMPPTSAEVDAFVNDPSPSAYDALVERMLASPHYGERWGRHWLDLVRYSESDGYRADFHRPDAWRYRDYVIRSINDDKPYDQFVREQLAGDELAPDDPDALVATAFLRHGVYEHNQRDARMHWSLIMDEMTDVTGEVLLGMSISCARCHDHKFDPILRDDYYRLQAFFKPILWRDDVPMATPEQRREHQVQLAKWNELTAEVRGKIDAIEGSRVASGANAAVVMFPEDIQTIYRKPPAERNSLEEQLAYLVHRQVLDKNKATRAGFKGEDKKKLDALKKELAAFDEHKPKPLPALQTVTDAPRAIAPTFIPGDTTGRVIDPGFLTILQDTPATVKPVPSAPQSSGRRTALAHWLTRSEHPLTARVFVNRVWQWHFGRGIVGTSSEFGRMGQQPTHPELLDYLTQQFLADGWRLKNLHRAIVTSSTYRQSSLHPAASAQEAVDPENKLRWRSDVRRLDAEQARDAMLTASGELKRTIGGVSVKSDVPRRSVYWKVMRNSPDPVLAAFDMADGFRSTSQRDVTTTPRQSLLMINGTYVLARAQALAKTILESDLDDGAIVHEAYRRVLGRIPSEGEFQRARKFLADLPDQPVSAKKKTKPAPTPRELAVTDLCHVLFNSNEFLYLD